MAARKKKAAVTATSEQRSYEVMQGGVNGALAAVSSNIKGVVESRLGACTAITANRNRAGKTAVLDSIRYALTGQHPIGPHYADLCGLTADGSAPWARLYDSAGAVVAKSEVPSGKKSALHDDALRLTDTERLSMLPMSSVRDLLTLGTAKAREEVFRKFGGDVGAVPVPADLDEDQLRLWGEVITASTSPDPAECLAAAGEAVRKHKRALSAQAKSLEDEKSRLLDASEGDATGEIDDLTKRIATAEKAQTFANLLKSKDELAQQLNDEITEFAQTPTPQTPEAFHSRPQKAERAAFVEGCAAALAEAKNRHNTRISQLVNAERVLALRKALDGGCIVCEGPEPSAAKRAELVSILSDAIQAMTQDAIPAQKEIERLAAVHAQAVRDETAANSREQQEWQQTVFNHESAQRRLKELSDHYKRVTATLADAGAESSADVDQLPSLRERLSKLTTVKAQAARIATIKTDLRRLAREQDDCKVVEEAVGDALNKLLEKIKQKAQDAVNAWMPDTFRAVLQLADSDGKPVCRWETVGADGRPHPRNCASGAEWAALTVALACAWTEGCPLKFVLLDDADIAGFSAENIGKMLDVLSKAVRDGKLTQVFVAWSRPEEIPSDEMWTIVSP